MNVVDDYQKRKQERKTDYNENVKGWKLRECGACDGSGYYDHDGSPECGSCNGTGKERYKPDRLNQQTDNDIKQVMDWYEVDKEEAIRILTDNDNAILEQRYFEGLYSEQVWH